MRSTQLKHRLLHIQTPTDQHKFRLALTQKLALIYKLRQIFTDQHSYTNIYRLAIIHTDQHSYTNQYNLQTNYHTFRLGIIHAAQHSHTDQTHTDQHIHTNTKTQTSTNIQTQIFFYIQEELVTKTPYINPEGLI